MADAIRRVLLLGDEKKGGSAQVVEQHASWLRARGLETDVVVDREQPLRDRDADVVVVWGGDGSLLAAARRMEDRQRPTLGINRGRLGFLTAFEDEQSELALQKLLAQELVEETRLMFRCRVEFADEDGVRGRSAEVLGLNDIVVSRAGAGGMIMVSVHRGEAKIGTYRGDGVIAATATGSTAYSMAAGGPVLAPDLDAIALTPLASHSMSAHPLALSIGGGLEFEVLETGDMPYAYCIVDGQVQMQVQPGTRIRMTTAPHRFRHLVQSPNQFWDVLVAKFGFAGMARSPEKR
ncbi:MAG: NAD(+)/NADH kinase [Planctomycetota bacterium]